MSDDKTTEGMEVPDMNWEQSHHGLVVTIFPPDENGQWAVHVYEQQCPAPVFCGYGQHPWVAIAMAMKDYHDFLNEEEEVEKHTAEASKDVN